MSKHLYPNLQKPIMLRSVLVKNRIMSAPNMLFRTFEGRPDDYYVKYLEHKARGGAGIVTLGEAAVCDGAFHAPTLKTTHENLTVFSEIAQAIHEHGAAASAELTHGGQKSNPQFNTDPNNFMGPCDFYNKTNGVHVRAMTEADMEYVANGFADTAEYYFSAGFDIVHLHYGHSWLMAQFLSPIVNRRTDDYGGSLENRMRFPLYVLKKVRERVGEYRPITLRLSGSERRPDGFTTDDIIEFLAEAQQYADMAEISSEDNRFIFAITYSPLAQNLQFAEKIKNSGRINIPIYTVGSIVEPGQVEEILSSGAADGVSMSRALIADPFLPKKSMSGHADDVTPCIRCLNCSASDNTTRHFICSVNPLIAREARLGFGDGIVPAKEKKKVLIVGGGPAGMQAAITAAERGHDITLVERDSALGGKLRFTETDTVKLDLRRFTQYLIRKTNRSGARILLNTEVTPELIERINPDNIIIATGSVPVIPAIKGIEKARHAGDIYFDPEFTPGERIVIIGGGLVGIDTGLHLSNLGKNVTVVEMLDDYALEYGKGIRRSQLDDAIDKSGMNIVTGARTLEVNDSGIIYEKAGEKTSLPADTVLYAVGVRKNDRAYFELYDKASFVTITGDAIKPGKVDGAVHGGFFAAMDI